MNINELSKRISFGKLVSYRQAREVIRLLGEQLRLMTPADQEKAFNAILRGNVDTTIHFADPKRDIGVRGNK